MRIVLDTNVLIDGAQDDNSAPAQLIDAVLESSIEAVITPAIRREYRKLIRERIEDDAYLEKIEDFIAACMEVAPEVVDVDIDDSEDLKFLEAAVGGDVDIVVTSDRHLLDVGEINAIRILTPVECFTALEEHAGENRWNSWVRGLGIGIIVLLLGVGNSALAVSPAEIEAKKQEIAALDEKIKELQQDRASTAAEAAVIQTQLELIQQKLAKAQLELQNTEAGISEVAAEQEATQEEIVELQQALNNKRQELRSLVRLLYEKEQTSLMRVFFSAGSLSDVLQERAIVAELQDRSIVLIQELRSTEEHLENEQVALAEKEEELANLQELLAVQRTALAEQRGEQQQFLQTKREEQVTYENRIKEAERAREEIEQDIFTLQSAGVKLKLTDAEEMARYAGQLTGVRPALLLGVLKIETNLGTNIGSGSFPDDMHPQSRDAFIRITKKLGLDPMTAPISARPKSFSGWGGAMGPAQFMPATWEGIEPRLSQLLQKPVPNPYELTDAFVATAILLADKGATTAAGEYEAVNRYIAGPNWQRFTWYGDRVLAVAQEYEAAGLK